jgi:hypothetical protein
VKKVLEYLPLISACLLYFGFCNLYYYYKEFNIDIYSFISSTDILLSFFPKIVLLTSTFYGVILTQLFDTVKPVSKPTTRTESTSNPTAKKRRVFDWFRRNIYYLLALYYLPVILLMLLLQKVFNYKSYELSDLYMFIDFIFLALIYIAISIHDKWSIFQEKPLLIALFLIIFIGQKIGSYRINEAKKLKDGITEQKKDHISFKYNNVSIATNDTVIDIGQTSTYFFLYNLKDSSTKAYPFSKMDDLIIK